MDDKTASGEAGASGEQGANRWYTVEEAAKYLGVSRPTVFRWMKQGTISFNKVGAATRFSKANLDAVVEKTTGQREAQGCAARCASCGNSEMTEGQLQGLGRLYFRPAKAKFWILEEALVPIRCHVCTACGYIQMHAETGKLRRLLGRSGEGARHDDEQ
jgi:excisionase family DNA binding protein